MANPENQLMNESEYPFFHNKIPVADRLEGFVDFIEKHPNFVLCPYIADKDAQGWSKSTSRVYMNQVLPNFLYVPVNIPKDDPDALRDFFGFVLNRQDILAVNITQPHKSSPLLRDLYLGDTSGGANFDTLIRNNEGQLEPYDLNSAAFVEWYKDEIGSFEDKSVILVGVGGVGEPIAKNIAAEKPKGILLVDIADKTDFAAQLGEASQVPIFFEPSLRLVLESGPGEGVIVINAAGKESVTNESEIWGVIQKRTSGGTFVDIRPHVYIDIVEKAKEYGWNAHTGHGMNARNDYVLLQGIARQIGDASPPSFEEFQWLVAQAS